MKNLSYPDKAVNIHEIRGQRVILDADLARAYEVSAIRLNEQVRRNVARFPAEQGVANAEIAKIFEAIRSLTEPPVKPGRQIGF